VKSKTALFLIAAVLICGHAFAHKIPPKEPPAKDPPVVSAPAASATAGSSSTAIATANATATSDANAASDAHNDLSITSNVQRSAPSLAQGGLFIGDCGAGGNAGGSNTHGAGFLGLTWTPKDCKLLLAAQAFHAIGMSDEACRMVTGISAVQARYKELHLDAPTCAIEKPVTVTAIAPIKPDLSNYVTRDELKARDKVMLEKTTGK
jgi:hypothetical protein